MRYCAAGAKESFDACLFHTLYYLVAAIERLKYSAIKELVSDKIQFSFQMRKNLQKLQSFL